MCVYITRGKFPSALSLYYMIKLNQALFEIKLVLYFYSFIFMDRAFTEYVTLDLDAIDVRCLVRYTRWNISSSGFTQAITLSIGSTLDSEHAVIILIRSSGSAESEALFSQPHFKIVLRIDYLSNPCLSKN